MNPEFKILGFQKVCSSGRSQPESGSLKVNLKDLLVHLCIIQKEKKVLDPRMMAAKILEWKTLKLYLSHYYQQYLLSINSE